MKLRILTGDRPTDRQFHLGSYAGTLKNRLALQDTHETFIMLADLHALTTHAKEANNIKENIQGLMQNYLAIGLDPKKVTFFVQSHIPALPQLALILGMLTPVSMLERQPALKEKLEQGYSLTYGLLGYPVLMAADILGPRANLVPVGKDQKAHVEFARDIAQKFNAMFGDTLTLPEPFIGEAGTLVGIDGKQKMSKSLGNAIYLLENKTSVREKVMRMYTDPTRIHPTDPGHIEGNPVFTYHDCFNANKKEVADLKARYQAGTVSDIEVKQKLARALIAFLEPIAERYETIKNKHDLIHDILATGDKKAAAIFQDTLDVVKAAMGF